MKPLTDEARAVLEGLDTAREIERRIPNSLRHYPPMYKMSAYTEKLAEILYGRMKGGKEAYRVRLTDMSSFVVGNGEYNEEDEYCRGMYYYGGDETPYAEMLEDFGGLASEPAVFYSIDAALEHVRYGIYEDGSETECNLTQEEFYEKLPIPSDVIEAFNYFFESVYVDVRDMGFDAYSDTELYDYVLLKSKKLGEFLPWFEKNGKGLDDYFELHSLIDSVIDLFGGSYTHTAQYNGTFYILSFLGTDGYQQVLMSDLLYEWYPSCVLLNQEIERLSKVYDFSKNLDMTVKEAA